MSFPRVAVIGAGGHATRRLYPYLGVAGDPALRPLYPEEDLAGAEQVVDVTLASVIERIPEIGIRRSVGATRRHVAALFITETVLLGTFGGLAGLLLGVVLSASIAAYAGWHTAVSWSSILVSIAVASAVGFASGVYPAWKASTVTPIDAVRHE
jgi:ABC-type antimicrobial peptide transport system permease subunit